MKRIVLKEELVAITGDYKLALVLNQMMYWSARTTEKNKWIYKSGEELSEEMMMNISGYSMRTHLKKLVAAGFLEERNNPLMKWDKTKQYRVAAEVVEQAVLNAGFPIEEAPATETAESNEENLFSEEEYLPAVSKIIPINSFREERDSEIPVFTEHEKLFGPVTPGAAEKINCWLLTNVFTEPEEILLYAYELAEKYKANSYSYVERILQSWQKKRFVTLAQVKQPAPTKTTAAPLPKWMKEEVQPLKKESFDASKAEAQRLKKELAERKENKLAQQKSHLRK
ncbi:DnaD domain protein [Alkalicoccus daliensis]|uniref:DnaD and phage-associated domain-containing protein n=1 Tax=Alkalicoccus daliensis TaxID=745820 RepID=A0A1H0CVK2_9BACI|nr:DnaD domain protein [Alkalicoccus daliensis]SDN61919.1 DnaD and phage-associated domain-containing protein [Alkalicoccus daliensis]